MTGGLAMLASRVIFANLDWDHKLFFELIHIKDYQSGERVIIKCMKVEISFLNINATYVKLLQFGGSLLHNLDKLQPKRLEAASSR